MSDMFICFMSSPHRIHTALAQQRKVSLSSPSAVTLLPLHALYTHPYVNSSTAPLSTQAYEYGRFLHHHTPPMRLTTRLLHGENLSGIRMPFGTLRLYETKARSSAVAPKVPSRYGMLVFLAEAHFDYRGATTVWKGTAKKPKRTPRIQVPRP